MILKNTGYGLRATGYGLQATGGGLQAAEGGTGGGLRAAGYGLRAVSRLRRGGPRVRPSYGPTQGRPLRALIALLFALAFVVPMTTYAQQPPAAPQAPPATQAPPAPDAPEAPDEDYTPYTSSWSRSAVRVGQNVTVRAGDRAREVVVVLGSATIDGRVDRDVVVVLGSLRLGPSAVVGGSVVSVASDTAVANGARVSRDFVSVLGGLDTPSDFAPGQEYVVIGPPGIGLQAEATVPWLTRGLLWGRLIVPALPWTWFVVSVIVAVYLVLSLLFARPVRVCRDMVAERPFSSFLAGLLVLVLLGPVFFILAVSIVGIPVIPFVVCGLLVAVLLGKIGLTQWIGGNLMPETDPDSRSEAVRSFAIGTAIILFAYMVPILGILVWAIGSVFGLGAATLALSSGLRRESPRRPSPTGPVVPPVAPPPAPVSPPMGHVPDVGAAQPLNVSSVPADELRSEATAEPRTFVPPPPPPFRSASTAAAAATVDWLSLPKAPFLDRLAAVALDVLLVSFVTAFLDPNDGRAYIVLLLGYHIVFWGMKATTVGGIICNLRVVRIDGTLPSFTDALVRAFSSILSVVALGIGYLWILYDPDKQAWHDRLAGTYVVKVPRGWPV